MTSCFVFIPQNSTVLCLCVFIFANAIVAFSTRQEEMPHEITTFWLPHWTLVSRWKTCFHFTSTKAGSVSWIVRICGFLTYTIIVHDRMTHAKCIATDLAEPQCDTIPDLQCPIVLLDVWMQRSACFISDAQAPWNGQLYTLQFDNRNYKGPTVCSLETINMAKTKTIIIIMNIR